MNDIFIENRKIGLNEPAFIIAELSCNHLNDFSIVEKTVKAAADSGVDALKLATLTPDTMTINSDKNDFIINADSVWDGRSFYDLYTETSMPYEWHEKIQKMCEELGLICFSTPYDISAAEFLKELDMPAYKIASFELVDIPLIKRVASYGKPVILSTGIAKENEISDAVNACKEMGNDQVILLKCTSGYPAPFNEINLRTIPKLRDDFRIIPGLSDHTLGIEIPIAAVSLGARVIEKHIILDRSYGGPDAHFSLNPAEFGALVKAVRNVEMALGKPTYALSDSSRKSRSNMRSLYLVRDIKAGETFTDENIRSIRPGYGMAPKNMDNVIGKKASRDIERGTPLEEDHIEGF